MMAESAPTMSPGTQLVFSIISGVFIAIMTGLLAPAMKRRWDRIDAERKDGQQVQVARIDAQDKFQTRLLARIRDLEELRMPDQDCGDSGDSCHQVHDLIRAINGMARVATRIDHLPPESSKELAVSIARLAASLRRRAGGDT